MLSWEYWQENILWKGKTYSRDLNSDKNKIMTCWLPHGYFFFLLWVPTVGLTLFTVWFSYFSNRGNCQAIYLCIYWSIPLSPVKWFLPTPLPQDRIKKEGETDSEEKRFTKKQSERKRERRWCLMYQGSSCWRSGYLGCGHGLAYRVLGFSVQSGSLCSPGSHVGWHWLLLISSRFEDTWREFYSYLGDFKKDILNHLGGTQVLYPSSSTTLWAAVAFFMGLFLSHIAL